MSTGDGQPVLQIESVSKRYGTAQVLHDVSLELPTGVVGLLGPNGSGKSTLIKSILGLVSIDKGQGQVLGLQWPSQVRALRDRVGYLPEDDCYIQGLQGIESIQLMARLSGLRKREALRRAHEVADYCDLGQERYRKIDTYSTGMKQRLKLAQAIVHDPEIVFLDEPTNGLDPKGQAQMLELVQDLWKRYGITVVLSSHLLHDVDRICEQIIIIARGQVLVHDSLENLKARRKGAAELVVRSRHADLVAAFHKRGWPSQQLPNGHIRVEHQGLNLTPVLELMNELRIPPLEIIPSPNALEETFVQALET
jgi:ABC-2 type transport system ATP-binding protein